MSLPPPPPEISEKWQRGGGCCLRREKEGDLGERVVFERFNYFLNDITYIFFITQLQVYCNGSKNCLNNTFIPSFLPLSCHELSNTLNSENIH